MRSRLANSFDREIVRIIKLFSYEFYAVKQDINVKCICWKEGTLQPDVACKKCLGLGYKIKIYEMVGASRESVIPSTMRSTAKFIITKNYYISSGVKLNMDDIIVDAENVFFIYQPTSANSFDNKFVYQKCSAIEKKLDKKIFLKNFHEIVGGGQ